MREIWQFEDEYMMDMGIMIDNDNYRNWTDDSFKYRIWLMKKYQAFTKLNPHIKSVREYQDKFRKWLYLTCKARSV